MGSFVDLSHTFEDGMPGFRLTDEDGTVTEYSASVRPFVSHEESAPYYADGVSFEVTELEFQTSVGTYLDSPYHRYPDRRDVAELDLDEVVLDGVAVDATGYEAGTAVGPEVLPADLDVAGKAVLFEFGWDDHWGTERYYSYPFLDTSVVERLRDEGAALVGVDALNVDDSNDPERPAHSMLLERDVLVVENLANVDAVVDESFRFYAVPLKAKDVAAMPVRAFAEMR